MLFLNKIIRKLEIVRMRSTKGNLKYYLNPILLQKTKQKQNKLILNSIVFLKKFSCNILFGSRFSSTYFSHNYYPKLVSSSFKCSDVQTK